MTICISVLGVLGLCRVGLGYPTQSDIPGSVACMDGVLGVLGLPTRARAIFCSTTNERKNLYARTNNPNKPNTLNTQLINCLISLGFICVGYVSSCGNVCWVLILGVGR